MMKEELIRTFTRLGIFLQQFSKPEKPTRHSESWLEELNLKFFQQFERVIESSHIHNPWFTENNVRLALGSIGKSLSPEKLADWLSRYNLPAARKKPATVAVIMAGNIPLVGFHDIMCVLISGHNLLAKLSVKDEHLPVMIGEVLGFLYGDFAGRIRFEEGRLKNFNAVIATGGDNTSRYFEYYFGKYPNIIRKNRNSAAILDGSESPQELRQLADDIFRYFGLGCRNVSRLFIPVDYDFSSMIETFETYRHYADHNQWANNYEYQRALHLIDQIPHLDTGFLILREENSFASPISVINYQRTGNTSEALEIAGREIEKLQCLAGKPGLAENIIPFGKTQEPDLDEYADNTDTMEFLLKL